jgi:RNA polymerase sigma factor (TIGR02999 family)
MISPAPRLRRLANPAGAPPVREGLPVDIGPRVSSLGQTADRPMTPEKPKPTELTHGDTPMRADELQAPLYRELRRLAASQMARESLGQTIQATELVHEAWIRLHAGAGWKNRGHFLATAARTMRRILTDRARRKSRIKRGGNYVRVGMTVAEAALCAPEDQVLLIDEALERFERIDPVRARVVTLKFYGELSNQEVAEELGVTERSVERYWAFAKAWLYREVNRQA